MDPTATPSTKRDINSSNPPTHYMNAYKINKQSCTEATQNFLCTKFYVFLHYNSTPWHTETAPSSALQQAVYNLTGKNSNSIL